MKARQAAGDAPLLVVGMHRSGTSLLAALLRSIGVDMGRRVTAHNEDAEILALHDRLLRRAGGSWEYPRPLLDLLGVPELRAEAERMFRRHAARQGRRRPPWGWKDPRTTLMLPLWRAAYGEVKLIVLRRDGRQVASSLARRARAGQGRSKRAVLERMAPPRVIDALGIAAPPFATVRCFDPDAGLELWSEYNAALDDYLRDAPPLVELRYEDFARDPATQVDGLSAAVGVPVARVRSALVRLRVTEPHTSRELLPSAAAVERHRDALARYGYGDS